MTKKRARDILRVRIKPGRLLHRLAGRGKFTTEEYAEIGRQIKRTFEVAYAREDGATDVMLEIHDAARCLYDPADTSRIH